MPERLLPEPDSPELAGALPFAEHRAIYRLLYERRDDPPTMAEIEEHLRETSGKNLSQRGRRVRDLYPTFVIQKSADRRPRYRLVGWKQQTERTDIASKSISRRVRAQVLQPQRCAMCGRTPLDDQVRLVIDHMLPQAWGGDDNLENLQPLCEECNGGKKDHFKTFDRYTNEIRQAASLDEPQRRIGELLIAFGPGVWVPSDVIGVVASAKEFQEDWRRRLRDLRYIGWTIRSQNRRVDGRVRSFYKLVESAPWPEDITGAIKAEYDRRQAAKKVGAA